jgi:Domain of unknown function (DUF4118)
MESLLRHRTGLANLAGLLVPLGLAAALVPFRTSFASAAAALVLVAGVVGIAVFTNRTGGYLAAVSAALWFDFFLTRPYERLAITQRADIQTAVSLLVVGVVVTELAARSRHHQRVAVEESDYLGRIYGISELATSGSPAHEVIERVRVELTDLLHLRGCRFESGPSPRPATRIEHEGHVIVAGGVWDVPQMGLPGPELELLVQRGDQTLGRFVLAPTPGYPVSFQRRVVAVTLADQVGAVLRPLRLV